MKLEKMTDNDYFAVPRLSNSFLKDFEISPAYALRDRKPTTSMSLGTMVHCYILEYAEFYNRYTVYPGKADKRTKEYKSFVDENPGKEIISSEDLITLESIKDSISEQMIDNEPILQVIEQSKAEIAGFFDVAVNGKTVECKMKIDSLYNSTIIDLKTTSDLAINFDYSVKKYKYYMQDAFYRLGLSKILQEPVDFYFLVVETSAPFGCKVCKLSDDYRAYADEQVLKQIEKYSEWSGFPERYSNDLQVIKKPTWME